MSKDLTHMEIKFKFEKFIKVKEQSEKKKKKKNDNLFTQKMTISSRRANIRLASASKLFVLISKTCSLV